MELIIWKKVIPKKKHSLSYNRNLIKMQAKDAEIINSLHLYINNKENGKPFHKGFLIQAGVLLLSVPVRNYSVPAMVASVPL